MYRSTKDYNAGKKSSSHAYTGIQKFKCINLYYAQFIFYEVLNLKNELGRFAFEQIDKNKFNPLLDE